MNQKVVTLIALMIVGALPAYSLYTSALSLSAWSPGQEHSENGAVILAKNYLKGMPTFAFDGMTDTIEVVKVEPLRMPYTWEVTIAFTSRHSGYGNRVGQMLAQVLTPHVTRIVVSEGRVIRAITDEVFDEMEERMLPTGGMTAEEAERIALSFLKSSPTFKFDGIEASIRVSEMYVMESYPVQYVFIVTFECTHPGYGDRTGQVLAQVITPHEIRIVVSAGEVLGAIIDGEWDELNQIEEIGSEILPPEEARSLAVAYILAEYPELKDLKAPLEWKTEDLTPEGLLGYSTIQYTSGDWTVKVEYPVVWKPTYQVEITLDGEPVFTWAGTVTQDGVVSTAQ